MIVLNKTTPLLFLLLLVALSCEISNGRTHLRLGTRNLVNSSNPFIDNEGLPKFGSVKAADLPPAISHLVAKLDTEFSLFESEIFKENIVPTYDDVLPELERLVFPLNYAWGVANHLLSVKSSDELKKAYEESQPMVVKILNKIDQSRPLFNAVSTIYDQWYSDGTLLSDDFYTSQKVRAVENKVLSMKLGGVGLGGEARDRFNAIELRLSEISLAYEYNILQSTNAFHYDIEDALDLLDVPLTARALWAKNYAVANSTENQTKTGDPHNGPWRITLDKPSYKAAMSHLPNRDIRERVYRAYHTRASEFSEAINGTDRNNVPYIYDMLMLKREKSRLLGFNSTADMSIATKMAGSVQIVVDFLHTLLDKALPLALREFEEIWEFSRLHGSDIDDDGLMPWDIPFWRRRFEENKFGLIEEDLRPFLPLPSILDGMFSLVEKIFNIEIHTSDGVVETWNEDVSFFRVHDKKSGEHLGSFYLDPYSRPGEKRSGAWMDVCVGKSEAIGKDIPVAYLNCNGSPPVGNNTSLMTFEEVLTLFHEFGHGLQHMLTTATVGDVAGINGVEWDAVELPSQFMEYWCFNENTIRSFAKHHKTGQPIPNDLLLKLIDQKKYGSGMRLARQIFLALIDMELHHNFDPESTVSGGPTVFDIYQTKAEQCTPYAKPIKNDRLLCFFDHIFGGKYSAGYYVYKWADVMSADAFSAFKEVGLDTKNVKDIGMRFRDTILSSGGSKHPMVIFKKFRGRAPSPEAFYRENNLV